MFNLIGNKLVPRTEIDLEHEHEIYDVEQKEWTGRSISPSPFLSCLENLTKIGKDDLNE